MGYDLSKYANNLLLLFKLLMEDSHVCLFFSALVRNSQLPKSSKPAEIEEASSILILSYIYLRSSYCTSRKHIFVLVVIFNLRICEHRKSIVFGYS